MQVTGLLLAAGMSKRMQGTNKLSLPFRSGSIVEESLKNLIASSVDQCIVVLGSEATMIADLLKDYESDTVRLIENQEYQTGRASSVRCGIENLDGDCDAALFMVGDKPLVRTDLITRAVQEFREHQPPVLCVRTPEARGHPIIFGRELFKELNGLKGDEVGQQLIEKYQDDVLWLEDDELQINVNTPEDYDRLIHQDNSLEFSDFTEQTE